MLICPHCKLQVAGFTIACNSSLVRTHWSSQNTAAGQLEHSTHSLNGAGNVRLQVCLTTVLSLLFRDSQLYTNFKQSGCTFRWGAPTQSYSSCWALLLYHERLLKGVARRSCAR